MHGMARRLICISQRSINAACGALEFRARSRRTTFGSPCASQRSLKALLVWRPDARRLGGSRRRPDCRHSWMPGWRRNRPSTIFAPPGAGKPSGVGDNLRSLRCVETRYELLCSQQQQPDSHAFSMLTPQQTTSRSASRRNESGQPEPLQAAR